jgi:hypothetical protein
MSKGEAIENEVSDLEEKIDVGEALLLELPVTFDLRAAVDRLIKLRRSLGYALDELEEWDEERLIEEEECI